MNTSGSGAYIVDDLRKAVIMPDKSIRRTAPKPYQLLLFLHLHRGEIFSAEKLTYYVWGEDYAKFDFTGTNARVAIKKLRKDIAPDVIDSVHGFGYGVCVGEKV